MSSPRRERDPIEPLVRVILRTIERETGVALDMMPVEIEEVVRRCLAEAARRGRGEAGGVD